MDYFPAVWFILLLPLHYRLVLLIGESVGFMAMFGAGTLPAMMLVTYAGQFLKIESGSFLEKQFPILL